MAGSIANIAGLRVSIPGYDGVAPVKRLLSGGKDLEIVGYGAGYVDVPDVSGLAAVAACELWDTNLIETREVVTVPGESDSVTLASPFSSDPDQFDVYTFGELNKQEKFFRIVSIGRSTTDQLFTIRATEYRPEIFADLEPQITSAPSTGVGSGIRNLSLLEVPNPTYDLPAVAVSWTPGPLTLGAYVYVKINDAPEKLACVIVGQSTATITNVGTGDVVTVRVVGYGGRGADNHDTAPVQAITLLGVGALPQNVANFYASACTASPANVTLKWAANPAADQVDHYEIRYGGTVTTPQWEFSMPLTPNPGASATSATFNCGPGQYLIVAVNAMGNPSGVPTVCLAVAGGSTEGIGGGGYGTGQYCFSGNVEIETPSGWVRFDALPERFKVRNDYGDFDAELEKHAFSGEMIDFSGDGELVTPEHLMRYERGWHAAAWHFLRSPRVPFEGTVYNAHVFSMVPGEQCYRLRNREVAHNMKATYLD